MGDDVAAHAALVLEVEVLEGLAGREAGRLDAGLAAMGLAGRHLAFEAGGQEVLVAPGIGPGPFRQTFHPGQKRRVLEFPAQIDEVPGAAHAAPVARS